MRIIPRVKKLDGTGKCIGLGEGLNIYCDDPIFERLSFTLCELLPGVKLSYVNCKNASNLIFTVDKNIERAEGYRITVEDSVILCRFSDFLGGRNAIATLAQIIYPVNGGIAISDVDIEDYPDADFRSFMHDIGRKYLPLDELKAHILLMAKCKMNILHFHFSEAVGFGIKLKKFPELPGAQGMQYTEDEIRELVDYAEKLGIDIIPEIDVPGHSNVFTSAHPEVACTPIGGKSTNGWAMCVGAEDTYTFLEELVREVSKLFKSKYFHLGTDEISMRDEKRVPHPIADWLICSRCCKLMEKHGYTNEVELFYYFLKRIYKIVTDQGKRLIIWNDWIDISKSPDIPRDILIEFWRVAASTRGPHIGCSMQRFLEEGFDVINANYPDTYIDLYVNYERLCTWDFKRVPATDENTPGKIIGGDVCAWDVHSHFAHSIPVSIVLFADKLWRRDSRLGTDFLKDASRMLIGNERISVFDYTRDVIMLDDVGEIFKSDTDREALEQALLEVEPRDISERYCKSVYLSYINKA